MSQWLPPLNSHDNHTIRVAAHQYSPPPPATSGDHAGTMISVKVHVAVNFLSSDPTVQRTMKGLSVWKSINLPSNTIEGGDLVPFPLNKVQWESRMIDGTRSTAVLNDDADLQKTLTDFLLDLISAPCNANRRKLDVSLVIKKLVTVPADEFEAWISWYDEQVATRESFESEYEAAIARPREEIELVLEETVAVPAAISSFEALEEDGGDDDMVAATEKEKCSICLEELENGAKVTRLPCTHQYHGRCVYEWLRRSDACPLCRGWIASWS